MDAARLEGLEGALDGLRQASAGAAILVEGKKDVAALEALGVGGQHLVVNRGASLQRLVDELAEQAEMEAWPCLILLLDWDRTGHALQDRIARGLAGRCPVDQRMRKELARWSHATTLEEVPADLAGLRNRVGK